MSLLNKVLEAHGGLAAFQSFAELRAELTIGGRLITTRGISGKPRALHLRIKTREVYAEIWPFPREGSRGVYTPNKTWIQSDAGEEISYRESPRSNFRRGHLHWPWDELDLLYFFGYALWNYLMTPFLFTWDGVEVKERATPHQEGDQEWGVLDVKFPESIPSHCAAQSFYFDEAGLLRRLDYRAEIFGAMVLGAHYCLEHKSFGGFMFPTRREVFPRLGSRPLRFATAMEGWLREVSLR